MGVAFSDGPMYKMCVRFLRLRGFYLNQDSSLQCLLRGVGGSDPTMRVRQSPDRRITSIPPVVHSRLIADISLKTLSSLTHL